jgi:hypothetical protein
MHHVLFWSQQYWQHTTAVADFVQCYISSVFTRQTGPRRAKDAQLHREAVSRSIAAAAAAASAIDSVQAATQLITNTQKERRQQQTQLSKHTTAILQQSGTVTSDALQPLAWCSTATSTTEHSTGLPVSHPAVQLHQVGV